MVSVPGAAVMMLCSTGEGHWRSVCIRVLLFTVQRCTVQDKPRSPSPSLGRTEHTPRQASPTPHEETWLLSEHPRAAPGGTHLWLHGGVKIHLQNRKNGRIVPLAPLHPGCTSGSWNRASRRTLLSISQEAACGSHKFGVNSSSVQISTNLSTFRICKPPSFSWPAEIMDKAMLGVSQ